MYIRTTANRSGKITVELHEDFKVSGYIDGECIVNRRSIFQKLTSRELVKGKWTIEGTSETYIKICKSGYREKRQKLAVKVNPLKEFTNTYSVTPTHFCKVFNAAVWKSAISPYKEFQSLYFGKGNIKSGVFIQVVKSYDTLTQALRDNQKNILPIINNYGKNPEELKKELGKGLWKKLCSNSFHRNKLIINRVEDLEYSVKYDSGALKGANPPARHWAKNTCKVPYTRMKGFVEEVQLFLDTERMANNLGLPFNEGWSKLKMQEKHNEYTTILNRGAEERRKKWDEEYRILIEKLQSIDLSKIYPQTEFELNGVKATILTTYDQIRQEGIVMSHCVGGYAESSVKGQYAVIHISGEDEETTLGLATFVDVTGKIEFSVQQHYGKYNSQVKGEAHRTLANTVVEYLNKLKLIKKSYEEVV